MKRVIAGSLLIFLALFIGVFSLFLLHRTANRLDRYFDEITLTVTDSAKEVNGKYSQMNDYWEKEKYLFHIFVNHGITEEFEMNVKELEYFCEKEDSASILEYCRKCKDNVNHIKESCNPTFGNVF